MRAWSDASRDRCAAAAKSGITHGTAFRYQTSAPTSRNDEVRSASWDYDSIVLEHAWRSPDLLDMETGGGEWLARASSPPSAHGCDRAVGANVAVAESRLCPLGVEVVHVEAAPDNATQVANETRGRLPFRGESFTSSRTGTGHSSRSRSRACSPAEACSWERVGHHPPAKP